jgi:hypothetical protein
LAYELKCKQVNKQNNVKHLKMAPYYNCNDPKRAEKPWTKQWNLNYTPGTKFEDPEIAMMNGE